MDDAGQKPSSGSFLEKELSPRGVGVLALCFFPFAAYFSIACPLLAIAAGKTPDPPSLLGFAATFIMPVIGIAYTFFPEKAEKTLGSWRAKSTPLGWCVWIAVAVLIIGSHMAMKAHVKPYRENAPGKPSAAAPSEK